MVKPKVSIIIPIYRVEKYLRKNLDSIVGQTLNEIEIICVNDGSPDNCLNILKEYQEKYKEKKIIIIDKKNEGVWKARIDGINVATGQYICFVDSDDYIEKDFVQKMYENINTSKADMAVCGFNRIDINTGKLLSKEMGQRKNNQIISTNNFEEVISINTALWNKIYKAEILKSMDYSMENPPRILEDMMFLAINYLRIKKIIFVNECLYNYIVREDSAMNHLKNDEIKNIHEAMLKVRELYIQSNCTKEYKEILSSIAFLHFGVSLMLKVFENKKCNFKKEYKDNLIFLNKYFPEWKHTKYLKLIYVLKNKSSNLKLAIVKKTYDFHFFKIFIVLYKFIINTLKIEVKW